VYEYVCVCIPTTIGVTFLGYVKCHINSINVKSAHHFYDELLNDLIYPKDPTGVIACRFDLVTRISALCAGSLCFSTLAWQLFDNDLTL